MLKRFVMTMQEFVLSGSNKNVNAAHPRTNSIKALISENLIEIISRTNILYIGIIVKGHSHS